MLRETEVLIYRRCRTQADTFFLWSVKEDLGKVEFKPDLAGWRIYTMKHLLGARHWVKNWEPKDENLMGSVPKEVLTVWCEQQRCEQ